MSATVIFSLANLNAVATVFDSRKFRCRNTVAKPISRFSPLLPLPPPSSPMKPSRLASRFSLLILPSRSFNSSVLRRFNTLMEWQECKVKKKVEVPISVAYELYSDRESIPKWMTFITSVKILKDKPDQSQWTVNYKAFGQNLEYSWLGKHLQPIKNQKIHWISLQGLPNKGSIRFFPLGPSSCEVELTFAYEVPLLLIPFATALKPLVQGLIKEGLEKFAEIAKSTKIT